MEELNGKHIRVKTEGVAFNQRIIAIGHITDDKWFVPADLAKKLGIK